jgi:Ca2+:H+ antiporter
MPPEPGASGGGDRSRQRSDQDNTSPTTTRSHYNTFTRSSPPSLHHEGHSSIVLSPTRDQGNDFNATDILESSFMSTDSPVRGSALSPERETRPSRANRPASARRTTSHAHRGQEFSVDDDETEIEEYMRTMNSATRASLGGLRKRTNTTKRKPPPSPGVINTSVEERPEEIPLERTVIQDFGAENPEEQPDVMMEGTPDSDDEDLMSEAESFTLKDRQEAINETHPFGIRIWKPAIYKKDRSVQKTAEGDIHSTPGGRVSRWLFLANLLWCLVFGIWLSLAAALGALVCFLFSFTSSGYEYGQVLWGVARFFLYPFGMFVRLEQDEAYMDEDEGEGRSISEYEQWQTGDIEEGRLFFGPPESRSLIGRRRSSMESASETDSLLGRSGRHGQPTLDERARKRRLFGRGEWNIGRVIFFLFFYGLIAPLLLLISLICWVLVFTIPMAKVTGLLFYHLRRRPLAMSFHTDSTYSRIPGSSVSVLLCTYRAVGWKYYKYTIDGTNIFFINLMGVVLFTLFDYWVLRNWLGLQIALTNPAIIFTLSLASIIPLAYFIGQAVASISAQSSMGVGAAINAFFSTVVEVFLYCVALKEGKGRLVEGSVVGSILAGILVMPGLSMCFGALVRKTQRFNARSAGVTSTMLLFGIIAAFGPTLFYQIYGTYQLQCRACAPSEIPSPGSPLTSCKRCSFTQIPALDDRFYHSSVKPFCYISAFLLFISYIIGLWFTLRTHAAVIWNTPESSRTKASQPVSTEASVMVGRESHAPSTLRGVTRQNTINSLKDGENARTLAEIRETQLYKKILGQSLSQAGVLSESPEQSAIATSSGPTGTVHRVPPKSSGNESLHPLQIPGLSVEQNESVAREVAELAATAAAVAAQEATYARRKVSVAAIPTRVQHANPSYVDEVEAAEGMSQAGGHDAPNWSRTKSTIILLGATLLYAIIAEILVSTVDVVLTNVAIDEKFLGITLFALVPNTTEFLNAISFAMNGNIALSMEIGSAYALQVCLLQIPTLVLWSALTEGYIDPADLTNHMFRYVIALHPFSITLTIISSLIFPQWDLVTVILCVFLLSYMYTEGKSNYFKGSILLLSYLVVIMGFFFSEDNDQTLGFKGYTDYETVGLGSNRRGWSLDL